MRYGRLQEIKIVESCVERIIQNNKEDKDHQLFLFLDEVYKKNKELSKQYHQMQVGLYIKFDKSKLLKFLSTVEAYNALEVATLCQENGLYKEYAFIQIKLGNKEVAIQTLIENCETVS